MRLTTLTIAYALVAYHGCSAAAAAQDDNDLNRVLNAWRFRQAKIASIVCTIEGKVRIPAGAYNSYRDLVAPEHRDGLPKRLPPTDHVFKRRHKVWLDFGRSRFRSELSQDIFLPEENAAFRRMYQVSLFDGESVQIYSPRAENTSPEYTPYEYQPELELRTEKSLWQCFQPMDDPFFLACGYISGGKAPGASASLSREIDATRFSLRGRTVIDGRTLTIVRTDPVVEGRNVFNEAWVDLERDGVIVKWTLTGNGKLLRGLDIAYAQVQGFWLPSGWNYQSFYSDGTLSRAEDLKVTEIQVNPTLADVKFHIDPTAGTVVWDETEDRRFEVDDEGERLYIDPSGSSKAASAAEASGDHRLWIILAVNSVALLCGLAYWFWRKRQKNPG